MTLQHQMITMLLQTCTHIQYYQHASNSIVGPMDLLRLSYYSKTVQYSNTVHQYSHQCNTYEGQKRYTTLYSRCSMHLEYGDQDETTLSIQRSLLFMHMYIEVYAVCKLADAIARFVPNMKAQLVAPGKPDICKARLVAPGQADSTMIISTWESVIGRLKSNQANWLGTGSHNSINQGMTTSLMTILLSNDRQWCMPKQAVLYT